MQGTFKLPSGRKIRAQSQRRYVLVADAPDYRPSILYRSDSVEILRKKSFRFSGSVVLDTVTKAVVS